MSYLFLLCIAINCTPKNADKIIDNNKVEVNQEMYRRMAEDICACTKNLIAVLDKIENTPKIEKDLKSKGITVFRVVKGQDCH